MGGIFLPGGIYYFANHMKTAVIIGAGPAGLTAAYELLLRTEVRPIVLEKDPRYVGGISRTVEHNGNRIDIGGHRFFSQSDRVMRWWAQMLPVAPATADTAITYRAAQTLLKDLPQAGGDAGENVMLLRPRHSRIIHGGNFFPYPLEFSFGVLRKLGFVKVVKIVITYSWALCFPRRPEVTLEDFFINRFGTELYKTFFKSYTEKVWGVPCTELSAEWGAQRIKGVSIMKAVKHAAMTLLHLKQKKVETSLIEQFLYPTKGPGFMWETVATKVVEMGGDIHMGATVTTVMCEGKRAVAVEVTYADGRTETIFADYVFSTTDIRYLLRALRPEPPAEVKVVSEGLKYRDFLTVGLLLDRHPIDEATGKPLHDTWMYVHEPGIQAGRVQFFHNWSPYLVSNPINSYIGLEYFCEEGDELWNMSDDALRRLAEQELMALGLGRGAKVIDGIVVRQEKAYPSYFGAYEQLPVVRAYTDTIENLFLIGRNGMHRYNNQDHSMLTAMTAVDNIIAGDTRKENIWQVNTEQTYHEEKS